MLHARRFDAEPASGIAQVLRLLHRRLPALLLVDFHLADGTGLELLRQLREEPHTAKLPVLLLASAFQIEHYRTHLSGPAPQNWLVKPIDEERLALAVSQWVGAVVPRQGQASNGTGTTASSRELTDRGSFGELPFARVLALAGRREAGQLLIQRHDKWLSLRMADNTIHSLSSSFLSNASLGQLLLREGRISRQTLWEAEAEITRGKRLGRWLIERGFLTEDELLENLHRQVQEKLQIVFSWHWYDATWHYKSPESAGEVQVQCAIPIREVIFAGITRFYNRDRLEMIFSKRQRLRRPVIPTSPYSEGLPIAAKRLLAAADGRSPSAAVRQQAGMEVPRFYQPLYALWVLDLVRLGEPLNKDQAGPAFDNDIFLDPSAKTETPRRH